MTGFNARPLQLQPQMPMLNRSLGGGNRQFNNRRQGNQNQGFRGGNMRNSGGGNAAVAPMRRKPMKRIGDLKGNNRNSKNLNGQKGILKKRRNLKGGRRNQNADRYQLNKPWVTDEIKAASEKKVELANQLKGNKNDELFAEFKTKRDEFVKLYDAARIEYNKNKVNDIR